MSHAYAARGARQTAVLAAIIGLHFAVFLAVTVVRIPPENVEPEREIIRVKPEPVKPEPVVGPPKAGAIDDYHVGIYPEPIVPIPDFPPDEPVTVPDRAGAAGEGASTGPTIVYVPPTLRTRQASVNAAINACYPAGSRRLNEEGTVVALVTIGASGSAVNWSVARTSGFARLDAAIGCVVRKLDFVAGRRDGQAVSAEARLPITFQLD